MNSLSQYFNPMFPVWLVVMLMLPLFFFFIWKEIKRSSKFLSLRIAAQMVVLLSILGILLKPEYPSEKKYSKFILLTPNYSKSKVDSLLTANPELALMHVPETVGYRGSMLLSSYYKLGHLSEEIQFVLGEGIPIFALALMDRKAYQFFPSTKPFGITQLQLSAIQANRQSSIQGKITTHGKSSLKLVGPGGVEDSVSLKGKGIIPFMLHFKPKQAGKFVYAVCIEDSTGVRKEKLPIEVKEEQKLTILFLQKFPTFEVRQLKNFLAEKGHHIALRYQLSKSNYRFEFANLASIRIYPITASLLQSFDLVIADEEALESLSQLERNALVESIRTGMGMVLLLYKAEEKNKLREQFLSIEMKPVLKDTVVLTLPNKHVNLPATPLKIVENTSVYPVTKTKSRILSAYMYSGFGRIGFQLLQETYRISLEGNNDDYTSLWYSLIEKTARTKNENHKISLKKSFPIYPDEPIPVEIISSVTEPPALLSDQVALPLTEHILIDNIWLGKTWAPNHGWHTLSTESSVTSYFVSEPKTWEALRITNQIEENEVKNAETIAPKRHVTSLQKPIAPLLFYMTFLIASGFLWLAPKF